MAVTWNEDRGIITVSFAAENVPEIREARLRMERYENWLYMDDETLQQRKQEFQEELNKIEAERIKRAR